MASTILEHFEVVTDEPVYFPGSTVTGHIRLETNKPILCSGLSLDASGEVRYLMDIRPHATRSYYHRRTTLYGPSYQTQDARWRNDRLHFASKAVPDGGVLHIPISKKEKKLFLHLVGHTKGRERVFGTTRLYPLSLVDNCRSKDRIDLPLTSDGAIVTAVVRCKASWHLTPCGDCQIIPLHVDSEPSRMISVDLDSVVLKDMPKLERPIDGFFCRITVESDAVRDEGRRIEIPKVHAHIPFSLKLPEELPSSLDTQDGTAVRYALECAFSDPTDELPVAVSHFTLVQPIPSAIPALATSLKIETRKRKWTFCGRDDSLDMITEVNRTGYAPGEMVRLHIKGVNTLRVPLDLSVDLVRVHHVRSFESDFSFATEFNMLPRARVDEKGPFVFDWELPFPVVAPTYEETDETEPLTWHYKLVVTVEARNRVICMHQAPVIAAALPIASFSEERGDRIHHSRVEVWSAYHKMTRVLLGEWREIVAEGIDGPLYFAQDLHPDAIRAANKAVIHGVTAASLFSPLYFHASAAELAA